MAKSAGAVGRETFSIKCGRCSLIFATDDCRKLEHFSIYRVICPQCAWPGRYLASELHALATARGGAPPARKAKASLSPTASGGAPPQAPGEAQPEAPRKAPQTVGES